MSAIFGWCLDGKHRGMAAGYPEYNEGKCPGKSNGLICSCWCHPDIDTPTPAAPDDTTAAGL